MITSNVAKWVGASEVYHGKRPPHSLWEHPIPALCNLCYREGFIEECTKCSGTFREPMPFEEVWGL